jgi:HSP20 family molecular chaperone IbpA
MTTQRTLVLDSPFLLGFEHTRALAERLAKSGDGYPPYNVEQTDDGGVRITLAVAGFTPEQLQVLVEGAQLTVSGRREGEASKGEPAFLHRGIAARNFQRAFLLAEGMEVRDAHLAHGLLHIDVVRPQPERCTVEIPIRSGA